MLTGLFFEGLKASTIETLERTVKRRRFAAGEILFARGDAATEIFALTAGRVKISRSSEDGTTQTLLLLHQGDLIGSLAVVQGTPHPVSAHAVRTVDTAAWTSGQFRSVLKLDPTLAEHTLKLVARRAEQMLDRLEEITSIPLEQRLARVLLRIAADCGQETDADEVTLALTRQDLAELTSVTLPTISRIMSRWRRQGLIAGTRGTVTIPSIYRFAALAEHVSR